MDALHTALGLCREAFTVVPEVVGRVWEVDVEGVEGAGHSAAARQAAAVMAAAADESEGDISSDDEHSSGGEE